MCTQLEWVCEDAYKLAVGQSFFFVGSVIGTLFFGYLADRIGRLPACILTTLTGAIGDFITSFVSSLPFFSAGRFISGLSTDTQYILMYILGKSKKVKLFINFYMIIILQSSST